MLFISTRGGADLYSSAHVITKGLAKDGGLFVPQKFPRVHIDDIMALHSLGYATSAAQVLSIFLTIIGLVSCSNNAIRSVINVNGA